MSFADLMDNPTFMAFRTRDTVGEELRLILSRLRIEPLSRWTELLELSDAVYNGIVEVKDMPALLAQAFGLDEHNAWRMTQDMLTVEIAPMQSIVAGLPEQIAAWRARQPVEKEGEKTYEDYAMSLAGRVHVMLSLSHMRRFASLIRLYRTEQRTREQTAAFLTRPVVIGGLGMTPEQAAAVLQFVDEEKATVQLVEGGEEGEKSEKEKVKSGDGDEKNIPEIAPSHALANETPIAARPPVAKPNISPPFMEGSGEAKEIADHQARIVREQMSSVAADARLEAGVVAAVNVAAPTLAKARIAKQKFTDIARMAIKGVRDPYQTRAILERDFSLTGEPVLELIEAIMQGMDVYNERGVGAAFTPSTNTEPYGHGVAVPTEPAVAVPTHAPNAADAAVLDKRFAAVAGKMPTASVASIMPHARVSAARSKEEELEGQEAKIDSAKLAAAAESTRPEPATAMLTVGSVPPLPPGEMPMVTDVQFRPHLVGPVEELGTMSPADFRRLSSNADEAGRKVQDVLHALESTSYEDRIRGVQAWRQSPVNALYMHMASEALNNGIAMAEVATRRRNKGEESLTPAELRAVANINAAIRF